MCSEGGLGGGQKVAALVLGALLPDGAVPVTLVLSHRELFSAHPDKPARLPVGRADLDRALMLWAYANGVGPWLSWTDHWLWLAALCVIVPVIHEFHFFCIHRLIHTPFLYKWVHSVHHNSINPSPWSSLSMHPVEHLLYFSTILYHLVIPSNPIIALYQLHFAGFSAVPGHVGFDKIEVADETALDSHAYVHYLHHKYFEVNYGDGLIPIDKWIGTFHDGSKSADERMKERFRRKRERLAAKKAATTPAE